MIPDASPASAAAPDASAGPDPGSAAIRRVAVFCGANSGIPRAYGALASELGATLAQRGLGLVYGGGKVGLMGLVADGALHAGGHVTGVLPRALVTAELAHTGVQDLRIVGTMHERKALMAELADAFVALPGGFGTLDESFEILTWLQLGFHAKPFGLLNVEGFYDHLLGFLDRAVHDGLVRAENRREILVDTRPDRLLDRLAAHRPVHIPKWITRDDL